MADTEHFDVVLVGAGISGIGMAHHIQEQCPSKRFAILETKATHGGTWDTHKYPGIRSDSDLYTFGYRFKPWTGAPIADGNLILDYMSDVIDQDGLTEHIRYNHKIQKLDWSTKDKQWTLEVLRTDVDELITITTNFFVWTGGYSTTTTLTHLIGRA